MAFDKTGKLMEDLSLHVLDIAENSINAGARNLGIVIEEDAFTNVLTIRIDDDGQGMPSHAVSEASDPFYTTRSNRRIGMGLALLKQNAERANGSMEIHSRPGVGTTVTAKFELGHIDRPPLGNMAETVTTLLASEEPVNICYRHIRQGKAVTFDTKHLESQLGDILLNSVEALMLIRNFLEQEESGLAS
jgi:anti-sigma regulatory factor (Ser/Thr protein kinase)